MDCRRHPVLRCRYSECEKYNGTDRGTGVVRKREPEDEAKEMFLSGLAINYRFHEEAEFNCFLTPTDFASFKNATFFSGSLRQLRIPSPLVTVLLSTQNV